MTLQSLETTVSSLSFAGLQKDLSRPQMQVLQVEFAAPTLKSCVTILRLLKAPVASPQLASSNPHSPKLHGLPLDLAVGRAGQTGSDMTESIDSSNLSLFPVLLIRRAAELGKIAHQRNSLSDIQHCLVPWLTPPSPAEQIQQRWARLHTSTAYRQTSTTPRPA